MRQALWFLIKVALFITALMWVAARPGTVEITWIGYLIETSVGVILALILGLLFFWTYGYKIFHTFGSVPDLLRQYRASKKQEEGLQAITHGFVAIAAGDTKSASKYARTAENRLPDIPLSRLLLAQTYLMTGQTVKARREFNVLLENNDAAFFGLRGLLNDALYHKNYTEGLRLIRQTAKLYPDQPWVLQILFDLETRKMEWTAAQKTLNHGYKRGVFDKETYQCHQQALHIAFSEELDAQGYDYASLRQLKKAFSLNAGFVPAVLRLAARYLAKDKKRAAIKTLQAGWQKNPHPDMAIQFLSLMPTPKKAENIFDIAKQKYQWMQKLTSTNRDHFLSHLMLGKMAEQGRMWDKARKHYTDAKDDMALLDLDVLENNPTQDNTPKKTTLHIQGRKWCCPSCAQKQDQWTVLCPSCGVFNKSIWQETSHLYVIEEDRKTMVHAENPSPALDLFPSGLIAPPQ